MCAPIRVWWGEISRAMLGISWNRVSPPEAFLRLLHPGDRERIAQSCVQQSPARETTGAPNTIQYSDGHHLDSGQGFRHPGQPGPPAHGGRHGQHQRPQGRRTEVLREAHTHAELVHVHSVFPSTCLCPRCCNWWSMPQRGLRRQWSPGGDARRRRPGVPGLRRSAGAPVGAALPLHDSLLWPDLQAGQPVLCNDIAAEGWELGNAYERTGVRAALAVPLRVDGAVVGAALKGHVGAPAFSASAIWRTCRSCRNRWAPWCSCARWLPGCARRSSNTDTCLMPIRSPSGCM